MDHAASHAGTEPHPVEHSHPGPREYVRIAIFLAIATAIEVGVYYMKIGHWLVPVLMVLMAFKFFLVVMWFMHLKFDSPMFRRFLSTGMALAMIVYGIVLTTFGALRFGAAFILIALLILAVLVWALRAAR